MAGSCQIDYVKSVGLNRDKGLGVGWGRRGLGRRQTLHPGALGPGFISLGLVVSCLFPGGGERGSRAGSTVNQKPETRNQTPPFRFWRFGFDIIFRSGKMHWVWARVGGNIMSKKGGGNRLNRLGSGPDCMMISWGPVVAPGVKAKDPIFALNRYYRFYYVNSGQNRRPPRSWIGRPKCHNM